MNKIVVKTGVYFLTMTAFVILAFITKDKYYSELFAALGITTGALASHDLSTPKRISIKKLRTNE